MKNTITLLLVCITVLLNAQTFDITKFGAIGDAKTLNTKSIQNAVDACNKNGGGTVLIPTGIFMTGTIYLKSNVNLFFRKWCHSSREFKFK